MKNCKALIAALLLGACPAAWADSYSLGLTALSNTNLSAALADFTSAVATSPTGQANVYLALTRVLALPTNDATAGAFLTRLGFSPTGRDVYHWKAKPATNSSGKLVVANNLDGDEFTAELRKDILPALGASETNLAQITDTTFTLPMPGSVTHFSDVTIDYGDVQMVRAMLSAATVFGYTLHTWNLNAQFQAVSNIVHTDQSIQAVLSANPGLLTITNTSDLAASRAAFTNAIHCYMAASQFIRTIRPSGGRYLFNLDLTNADDMNAESNFRLFLTDLESSLNTPFGGPGSDAGAIPGATFYGPISGLTNHTVSMADFFAGDFNLRALLPTLTPNGFTFIWDSFPDPNLGGVFTGLTETNLGKAFRKGFHAQAQLSLPGVNFTVIGSVGKNGGQNSLNGVVQDGAYLYGTTPYGGVNGSGSVFKLTTGGVFSLLYSATPGTTSPTGSDNPSSLLVGRDGNLYGTTEYSDLYPNGSIFKLTTVGVLTGFFKFGERGGPDKGANGGNPLIQGTDGNFYGTTPTGGDNGSGIIFQITSIAPYQFSLLYSFPPANMNPVGQGIGAGALVQGRDGNFYGVTQFGGDFGSGSIFQFIPGSGANGPQFNTLYSFPPLSDGFGNPIMTGVNTLVQGSNGLFYGSTEYGGTNDLYSMNNNGFNGGGDGAIFSIDTLGNFTSLYSFDQNGFDGFGPIGAMVQATNGSFYGITTSGGATGDGTIFQFTPGAGTGFVVWFNKSLGQQNGNNRGYYNSAVSAGLTQGAGGFYGTAPGGGANGNGTVFSLTGSSLSGNYPPSIGASPVSVTDGVGSDVTLTVTASGTGTLSYQWKKNGAVLGNSGSHVTGAGTANLTLTGLTLTDAGSYVVVVKNNYGSATSAVAVVTVVPPPRITSQPPATTNIGQGQMLSLTVGAGGTGPFTYQWTSNEVNLTDGGNVSGSATSNLVINPAVAADSGSYAVMVANAFSSTNSRVSAVTVGVGPLVSAPASTNGLVGSNVTLTVTASGTAPLHYHWIKNGTTPLVNGVSVTGATSNILTLRTLTLANTGSYDVVVTNIFGKATSMVAVLTVRQGPIINSQPPATLSLLQGQPLKLKVAATGTSLIYQWSSNNVNLTDIPGFISGSANSNLIINPAVTGDSASYSVVVSNSVASVTSLVSVVTVKADTFKPGVTITSPALAGTRSNAPVTFRGTASETTTTPENYVLITNVNYWITNLNGSLPMSGQAALTAGPGSVSNWTVSVTPPAGSNVFAVQSQDYSGNTSAVISLKFFLKSPALLTVITNTGSGNGSVHGASFIPGDAAPSNNAMLNVGESYSITETPGRNSYFVNWTGTALMPIGATTNPTLDFIMENTTSITANFITNMFVGMAGTYNGLFSSEALGVPTEETAGLIGNLILKTNGTFTATLNLAGAAPGISGGFNPAGYWSNVVGKVKVELTVNAMSAPRTITASVTPTNSILVNGVSQPPWTSEGTLFASLAYPHVNAGAYTLLIPPATANALGAPLATPPGYGYALLTNTAGTAAVLPSVTITGMLADGTTISQNVGIGEDNGIPVFPSPFTSTTNGLLFGRINLSSTPTFPGPTGDLTWIRKASATGLFKAGFTNPAVAVQGSPWLNSVLFLLNAQLVLSNYATPTPLPPIYVSVVNKTNLVPVATSPYYTSGSINTNTGQLTITFTNYGVRVTGRGAFLQEAGFGGGLFVMPPASASPTNAGSISLQP
jgi:uncharacterized repeat protein (TIGR03803 family)